MTVAETFRRALEGADYAPLTALYAPDAAVDAVAVGRRFRLTGGAEVPGLFAGWWSKPGRITRWDARESEGGLTLEFERLGEGGLARQRHFIQLRGGLIVRHQLYACQPLGSARLEPTEEERELAARATAGLGEIVRQEPLTHAGQTGSRLERVVLADGTRLVLKHLRTDDWVARATLDRGREFALWDQDVLARLPDEVDTTIVTAGRAGDASWLVMRDVSDDLLGVERPLSRAEGRRLVSAAAAIHRTFAGEPIDELCPLRVRLALGSPATLADAAAGLNYIAKVFVVGWEVFAEHAPADVADAVFAVHDDPGPLSAALLESGTTLVHTDLRGANLGFSGERVIVLDWGLATLGPPAFDFAWHLFVNGWRIDASREELVEDFRAAEGELVDDRQLELALLAGLAWHGGLLSHELIESDAAKRERARDELDWWTSRVRRALELL